MNNIIYRTTLSLKIIFMSCGLITFNIVVLFYYTNKYNYDLFILISMTIIFGFLSLFLLNKNL